MEEKFDLIVAGLGPAGLKAVNLALKAGLKVLAFEENEVGGTCLNKGCVPTKAILHKSEIYNEIKNSQKTGFDLKGEIIPDIEKIWNSKDEIVKKLSTAAEKELIKKGLTIKHEKAVVDFKNLTVNGAFSARDILISTGSKPFELKGLEFDHKKILNSDDILNLKTLPNSIAIIGSGAIGVEWARILSNFNVNVTVVEKAASILPLFDVDIQKRIARIFKQKKIKALTGVGAVSFKSNVLELENGETVNCEVVLSAVGRKRTIPAGLQINPDLTTNFEHVYASGDISAKKMLAHTASMQAEYVINKILGKKAELVDDLLIPSVIYGTPEIASVGINEQDILNKEEYKIYNLPISYLAKSWCDGQIDGFIKIITKDGLVKGAHIISNEASSLITQIQILMKTNYKVSNLNEIVFAHPTYSEGLLEAILNG